MRKIWTLMNMDQLRIPTSYTFHGGVFYSTILHFQPKAFVIEMFIPLYIMEGVRSVSSTLAARKLGVTLRAGRQAIAQSFVIVKQEERLASIHHDSEWFAMIPGKVQVAWWIINAVDRRSSAVSKEGTIGTIEPVKSSAFQIFTWEMLEVAMIIMIHNMLCLQIMNVLTVDWLLLRSTVHRVVTTSVPFPVLPVLRVLPLLICLSSP